MERRFRTAGARAPQPARACRLAGASFAPRSRPNRRRFRCARARSARARPALLALARPRPVPSILRLAIARSDTRACAPVSGAAARGARLTSPAAGSPGSSAARGAAGLGQGARIDAVVFGQLVVWRRQPPQGCDTERRFRTAGARAPQPARACRLAGASFAPRSRPNRRRFRCARARSARARPALLALARPRPVPSILRLAIARSDTRACAPVSGAAARGARLTSPAAGSPGSSAARGAAGLAQGARIDAVDFGQLGVWRRQPPQGCDLQVFAVRAPPSP